MTNVGKFKNDRNQKSKSYRKISDYQVAWLIDEKKINLNNYQHHRQIHS